MHLHFNIYRSLIVISCLGLLLSCSGNTERSKNDSKPEDEKAETQEAPQDLSFSLKQMNTVGIETGPMEKKNLNAIVKANGQLAVPPQNKADVSILSGGIMNHIYVLEGQQVRRGQTLATIANQDLIKIQQDYLAAINNFSYIEAEYKRQTQLKAAGAGTGKSYQLAEASYKAEQSRIRAYQSQLKQLGIAPARISDGNIVSEFPVRSPISGTVGQVIVNTGAFVQPGTSIMEVVDNSKIHCDLTVFEKDLMQVKVGQKVAFQLTNQDNHLITGTINGINKSFENESKGVIVHAVIDNKEHRNLIPGMYVTALISTGSQLMPAVPVDAVVRSQGKSYIFLVTGTESEKGSEQVLHFKKVEVRTGVRELGYVEIKLLNPLPENAQVVLKGAFYLESKLAGGADED